MYEPPPSSSGRPSSRRRVSAMARTSPMDVTMNSSVMVELFDGCIRTSRNGQIVQLIVPKDAIETVGFAHRVAERIDRDLYLSVVDEEDELDSVRDNLTIEYAVV